MAAMKRLSKSEARRIKSLYNAKVVEAASGSGVRTDEGKGNMVEKSLVPDEIQPTSSQKMPPLLQAPKVKLLKESENSSPRFSVPTLLNATGISHSTNSSPRCAVPRMQDSTGISQSANSSPHYAIPKMENAAGINRSPHDSPQFAVSKIQNATVTHQSGCSSLRFASSSQPAVPTKRSSTGTNLSVHSSPQFSVLTQCGPRTAQLQDEIVSTSTKEFFHAVKVEMAQNEKPKQQKHASVTTKLATRTSLAKSIVQVLCSGSPPGPGILTHAWSYVPGFETRKYSRSRRWSHYAYRI